jgi:hypothetical protein
MVRYYGASSHDDSSAERKKLWKPCETLDIINPDPGYQCITCVGYAPSQRRRCRNPINAENKRFIMEKLDEIAYLHPDSPTVTSRLRAIAGRALCVRYHQNQAGKILQEWQDKIQRVTPRNKGRQHTRPARDYANRERDRDGDASDRDDATDYESDDSENEYSESDSESESEREIRERRKERSQRHSTKKNAEPAHDMEEVQKQLREMKKMVAELQEELKRQRQDDRETEDGRRERQRKEREERVREAKRHEEERKEEERRNKERQEKEQQEQQRKEKEQQERQQKAREQAAQNERIRQKAQKLREEREKKERERLQKEREEWDKTWTSYQDCWTAFRGEVPLEGLLEQQLIFVLLQRQTLQIYKEAFETQFRGPSNRVRTATSKGPLLKSSFRMRHHVGIRQPIQLS